VLLISATWSVPLRAFVVFVQTFAVWIYILLIIGILVGIKLFVDAQRLSRTTLFSLEQERATELSFKSILTIAASMVGVFLVTGVLVLIAPFAPTQDSSALRAPTGTLAPIILPTNTVRPTASPTFFLPTETAFPTSIPISATITRIVRTILPPPTVTPAYSMPAPTIAGPLPNGGAFQGEGQANAALTFKWNCDLCILGPNDWYEVSITFTDRSGAPRAVAGRTQDKFLSLRKLIEGGAYEIYQKAKEDTFQWHVQVKHEPGNQPYSPPSETWKFIWR
jgi:hypothetical protein